MKSRRKTLLISVLQYGIYALLLSFTHSSILAQNQTVDFNRFGIDDGLSNSYVTSILQDSRGFMWFGTQDGLNRFDGYQILIYKCDPSNSNSLSDNYIRSIIETRDGMLWIGTESSGLNSFDPKTQVFTHYQHDPQDPNSLGSNRIKIIYEDPDTLNNVIWIGMNGSGLDKFDTVAKTFIHYTHDPGNSSSLSNNYVSAIHRDHTGDVWVGTLNGLSRLGKSNTWKSYYHDPKNQHSIGNSKVFSILQAGNGLLLFGTLEGIYHMQEEANFVRFDKEQSQNYEMDDVQIMEQDRYGNIWIGTFHGLKRLELKVFKHEMFRNISGDQNSLSADNITSIFEDRAGLLWFGTGGGGINRMKPNAEFFLHYNHIPGNLNSLSYPSIRGIYEDTEGILWVGGYGGLNRIDRSSGSITHYKSADRSRHQLSTDHIFCILGDPDNNNILWLGSEGDGLFRFEKNTGSIKHYLSTDTDVQDVVMDEDRVLWVATFNGLVRINTMTDELHTFNYEPDNDHNLSNEKTSCVYQDSRKKIWVGTVKHGLNRFDPESGKFTRFLHHVDEPNSVSINRIKSIYEDRSGVLWIGTNGGGLNRFDPKTESFTSFTEKDGLPNDVIYGILEDESGDLWLSTNHGVSRFNPNTKMFKNYDVNDGLQSNEFNTGSYFQSVKGEMFFGGINGFNAFFPDRIHEDSYIPSIVITDFSIINWGIGGWPNIIENPHLGNVRTLAVI